MSSADSTISAQVNKLNIEDGSDEDTPPRELVAQVDDLLNQLSTKFSSLSGEILGKMDDMSRRLDNLEATIQASNAQAQAEAES